MARRYCKVCIHACIFRLLFLMDLSEVSNVKNALESKHYFTHHKFWLRPVLVRSFRNILLEKKSKRGGNNLYIRHALRTDDFLANESVRNHLQGIERREQKDIQKNFTPVVNRSKVIRIISQVCTPFLILG